MTTVIAKHSRILGPERTKLGIEMANEYEQGRSIRAIAQEHARSYGFVHRVLTEMGVELRSRGGGRVKKDEVTAPA